jgi:hypothetical protein
VNKYLYFFQLFLSFSFAIQAAENTLPKNTSKQEIDQSKASAPNKDQFVGVAINVYQLDTSMFSNVDKEKYVLRPNGNGAYSFSSAYKNLGISFSVPTGSKDIEEYAATKAQDYQLSFNFTHFNLEIFHQKYQGLLIDKNTSTVGFASDLIAKRQAIKLTYFQEKKYLNGAKGDYFAHRYKEKSGGYLDSSITYALMVDRFSLDGLGGSQTNNYISAKALNNLASYKVDSIGLELGASMLFGHNQTFMQPQLTLGPALQSFSYVEDGQESKKNLMGLSYSAGLVVGMFVRKHLFYFDFKYHSLSYKNPTLEAQHTSSIGGFGYKYFF